MDAPPSPSPAPLCAWPTTAGVLMRVDATL